MDEYREWAATLPAPDSGKLIALGEWCIAWDRCGRNVFDLSPDFVAAMLMTDPSAIVGDVRLPFPAVLVTIPSGFATGNEGGHYTKVHVLERSYGDGSRVIVVQATDGACCLVSSIRTAGLTWDVVERSFDDDGTPMPGYARVDGEADDTAQRTVARIVFGLLGYMGAVKDAATRREVQRKPKRAPTAKPPPTVAHWDVGRTIKIDPRLVQAARGGSREVALRIKHRFIVRGHYRNQAHGPGRSERRMQWIAPFWKGPGEGAQIVHTYKPMTPEGAADG
jgi:hypothetical protein